MFRLELNDRTGNERNPVSLVSQSIIFEILPEAITLHALHIQPTISQSLQSLRAGLRQRVEQKVYFVNRGA